MGFDRGIGPDRAQRLQMSNEELARMVATLGITVQALKGDMVALTDRVKVLGAAVASFKRRDAARKARAAERAARERQAHLAAAPARAEPLQPAMPIARIVSEVAAEFGIEVTVILGRSRVREVAFARQEVYMRAREAGHSFSKIGREMGRDHGTIVCGIKSVQMRRAIAARRRAVCDV